MSRSCIAEPTNFCSAELIFSAAARSAFLISADAPVAFRFLRRFDADAEPMKRRRGQDRRLLKASPVVCGSQRGELSGFERRDLPVLRALAIDEQEFLDHVWPELPSARPERNLPFSYVWGDLHQKSEAALAGTLASHGGQHYELVAVRFLGQTTQYKSYVVHRETELTVTNTSGATVQLRLFGSTLEKDGRFKVFSDVLN
jgi:hypothetical protein